MTAERITYIHVYESVRRRKLITAPRHVLLRVTCRSLGRLAIEGANSERRAARLALANRSVTPCNHLGSTAETEQHMHDGDNEAHGKGKSKRREQGRVPPPSPRSAAAIDC